MMHAIDFKSRQCKMNQHSFCHGSWTGLGFQCDCGCNCHEEKNHAIVEVEEPASIALLQSTSEGSKVND